MTPVEKIMDLCRRWGFPVKLVDGVIDFDAEMGTSSGPNRFGINWKRGEILIDSTEQNARAAADLVHELGHLLVGGDPEYHDEIYGPGLALDFYHLKFAGVRAWGHLMADFAVDETVVGSKYCALWPQLPSHVRMLKIRRSLAKAVERNLLTADGVPTFVRQP